EARTRTLGDERVAAPVGERGVVDEERIRQHRQAEHEALVGSELGEGDAQARAQALDAAVDERDPADGKTRYVERAPQQLVKRGLGDLHRGHGARARARSDASSREHGYGFFGAGWPGSRDFA